MFGSRERLYNAWVRDHYRFLLRSAWALTGSRAVAEEVVQDCFELAWRHLDQLRDRALARPWLFRILRREALRNLIPATDPSLEPYDEGVDERIARDTVGVAEQRMDILAALQALPAIHREALTLFYFEDMPVAEMALALDVAPGTVLSRLSRAREALRMRGIAFDGGQGVREVAYSTDGGQSWRGAKLGQEIGRYSFREFTFGFTPDKGSHDLRVRAWNRSGQSQPMEALWQPAGYMRNVVESVKVVAA